MSDKLELGFSVELYKCCNYEPGLTLTSYFTAGSNSVACAFGNVHIWSKPSIIFYSKTRSPMILNFGMQHLSSTKFVIMMTLCCHLLKCWVDCI